MKASVNDILIQEPTRPHPTHAPKQGAVGRPASSPAPATVNVRTGTSLDESLGYVLGQTLGDYFTDKYFSLPEAARRRWDATRLVHHGALGQILADGGAQVAESVPRGVLRRAAEAARAFGEGLAESDRHDEPVWWTDGKLASTATVLALALERRR